MKLFFLSDAEARDVLKRQSIGANRPPDGTISREVMPDKLHVAGPGYTRWMETMGPTLDKLLKARP